MRRAARRLCPEIDARQLYLEHLESDLSVQIALKGLFEIEAQVPITAINKFLTTSDFSVRLAAYNLLFNQQFPEEEERALCALESLDPAAVQAAIAYLSRTGVSCAARCFAVVSSKHPFKQRKMALALLGRQPKWEQLPYLFDALALEDDSLRAIVADYILRWWTMANRSALAPNAAQLASARASLANCSNVLSTSLRRELEFYLR